MVTIRDIVPVLRIPETINPESLEHDLSKYATICSSFDRSGFIQALTPVIVSKNELKHEDSCRVSPFFPTKNTVDYSVHRDDLCEVSKTGIFTGKAFKTDVFNFGRLSNIREFVAERGSLYCIIDDVEAMKKAMNIVRHLQNDSWFKHGILLELYGRDRLRGQELALTLSFHDIRYSYPLFNKRAVDGMLVDITLSFPKQSVVDLAPRIRYKAVCVLSNFKENVLYLDGAKINGPINSFETFRTKFIEEINNEKKYRDTELEKSKHKVSPKETKVGLSAPSMAHMSDTTGYTMYNTTTTSATFNGSGTTAYTYV